MNLTPLIILTVSSYLFYRWNSKRNPQKNPKIGLIIVSGLLAIGLYFYTTDSEPKQMNLGGQNIGFDSGDPSVEKLMSASFPSMTSTGTVSSL